MWNGAIYDHDDVMYGISPESENFSQAKKSLLKVALDRSSYHKLWSGSSYFARNLSVLEIVPLFVD